MGAYSCATYLQFRLDLIFKTRLIYEVAKRSVHPWFSLLAGGERFFGDIHMAFEGKGVGSETALMDRRHKHGEHVC